MNTVSKTIGWHKTPPQAALAWVMILALFVLLILVFAFEVALTAGVFFAVVILAGTMVIVLNKNNAKGSVLWLWLPCSLIILIILLAQNWPGGS
jgi:hypothetical protein